MFFFGIRGITLINRKKGKKSLFEDNIYHIKNNNSKV